MVLLIAMVALLGTSNPSNAFWHLILNENYEMDPPPPEWPWDTDNGTSWYCLPWPPMAPTFLHTWGKEDSTVYRVSNPNYYRSIWCYGLPNDRIPGQDTYGEWVNAWAIWGPIDITEDMEEAGGVFYMWGSIEPWNDGAGDNFYFAVTDNMDNLGDITLCPTGFEFWRGTTHNRWENVEFNFADLDSAGDSVSYMPQIDEFGNVTIRDTVWLCLVFTSNGTEREEDLGVFVDDFSVGYDDGLFDFDARGIDYMVATDTTNEYYEIHVGDPVRVRCNFSARGPNIETEAKHVLYIDSNINDDTEWWDLPYDSLTRVWESARHGVFHNPLFPNTFVPQDTGNHVFAFALDADSTVEEWSDSNNFWIDTVYVHQGQTEPYINWIQPNLEVVQADTQCLIIWEAYNSPDYEWADICLYYDDDDNGFDGELVPGGYGIRIVNGVPDTLVWNTRRLPDSTRFWIHADLNDNWFPTVREYAPQPVFIVHEFEDDTTDTNSVADDWMVDIPDEFGISSLYPNPFNPTVEVTVAMPEAGDITLRWFSLDGRMVDKMEVPGAAPGYRKIAWTPHGLSSGMYLLQVNTRMGQATRKVLYLK